MFATTENLLPNIIRRQQSRARPFATVVGAEGVVRDVSFSDLENASNKAAWYLDEKIKGEQVLYMGPNDIRYLIWVIAATKTGKCVLFPSLANQIPANQRFFETVGAKTLFYAPEAAGILAPLLEATRGSIEQISTPAFEELMSRDAAPVYPFEKSFDDVKDTRFMGLHTSGTSGHPKPIYWTHSALTTVPAFLDPTVKDHNGNGSNLMYDLFQGNNILVPFPLSHFGGMGSSLGCIYCDNTIVLPAPGVRLTPETYTLLLQHGKCTVTATPPSLLEVMLNYPPGVEALANLKHVAYTGGPVNPSRGEILAKKIPHLFPILASTEGGIGRFVSSGDSSHWNSFKFVDVGQRMDEVAPGIYELVYPRTDLVNRVHAYFHTHPHLNLEFRTSDLFSPVDDQNEWWVYKGRADNWIAMSNGLKMDPTEIEHTIASHPDVIGVMVAGAHRFRLCVLIELNKPVDDQSLENIWPIIEEANKKAPKFGRVPKELVLFATSDKPFLRAGKGTIQRRLTIQAYEEEINRRYDEVEEGLLTSGIPLPASTKPADLIPFLQELCSETLLDENTGHNIGVDDDILAFGLDSLSSFVLLARLKAALRKYGVEAEKVHLVNNKLLYTATTIRQLAEKLSQLLSTTGPESDVADSHDITVQLLEKYDAELQKLTRSTSARTGEKPDGEVVLLTGSTGSLGSHILASLLSRTEVKKVFLLNRNGDAKTQAASLKARSLPGSLVDDKRLIFFQIKPTEPKFGLSDADYNSLAQETTSIVHNAYPVNFLLSVQSFEPQFQFLLNMLKLAAEGQQNPAVLFVSSITAATPAVVGADGEAIPEEVLHPDKAKGLLQQGYARSKYICERLLANYASNLGGRASVLRVGQVCGPSSGTGIWNVSEWVPSLVLSSKFLGAIPDSLGSLEVNWVPVDKLGDIVAELVSATSQREKPEEFLVFNVVNPATTSWDALLPALKGIGGVDIVSATEWIDRLEKSDKDPHIIPLNPAAKIIDFYKETMVIDEKTAKINVANLLRASQTAANLPPIDQGHMARWMQGWGL